MKKRVLVLLAVLAVMMLGACKEETAQNEVVENSTSVQEEQSVVEDEIKEIPAEVEIAGAMHSTSWDSMSLVDVVLTEEDMENLQYMVNLKKLFLNGVTIPDTSVLTKLPSLNELSIGNCGVSDLSFLANMPQLKELSISREENITDYSVIGELTNLTRLKLNDCGLTDISFLANLTNLTSLGLDNNDITDISVVSNMDKLEYLYLVANRNLTDISPVSTLVSLKQIDTLNTSVADIKPLFGLANLNKITVDGNIIPQEQRDEFKTLHPDCKVEYSH